ncbi:hypothetical protein J7J83_03680 [bacterium]|nr:hypothetical protein [bacterium]
MAEKRKMKGWVKGLIALVVIGVLGFGYYGVNGELFQGRLNFFSRSAKTVRTADMNKVVKDRVTKVGMDKEKVSQLSVDSITKLKDGNNNNIVKVDLKNTDVNDALVNEMSFSTIAYNDNVSYGAPYYSLVINGQKINAKVKIEKVKKDGKSVKMVSFIFEEPLKISVDEFKSFEFVSTDKDNMQYDFNSVTIDNKVMTKTDLK